MELTDADREAAAAIGVIIAGTPQDQINRAALALNTATRLAIECGYNLLAAKSALPHGEFTEHLDELGFSRQRASEAMLRAKFITAQPAERRAALLQIQPSKLLVLADASPEAVEALLDEEGSDPADLSVRALRTKVRELEARAANADVDRARAEAEAEGLRKQLRRQQRDDEDALIPAAMADLRQEIGAQVKKAELAIQSMERLARDLAEMQGGAASDYVSPTAQLALAGMISLRVQLDSRMAQFKEQFDCEGITGTGPDKLAALLPFEVEKLASHWAALTDAHKHESLLRAHERESARPRGRGRPKAAPVEPV